MLAILFSLLDKAPHQLLKRVFCRLCAALITVFASHHSYAINLVLVDDLYCPFTCENEDRPGIFIELARVFYEPLGHNVELRTVPYKRAIRMVSTEAQLSNTDTVYFLYSGHLELYPELVASKVIHQDQACFYSHKNNPWKYENPESPTVILGAINGYDFPGFAQFIRRKDQRSKTYFTSGSNPGDLLIRQLLAHRVDAIVDIRSRMQHQLRKDNLEFKIKEAGCIGNVPMHYFFQKDHPLTVELINTANAKINSPLVYNTIKRIYQRYALIPQ